MARESILADSQWLGRQKINIIPLSQNTGKNARGSSGMKMSIVAVTSMLL